MQHIEGKEFFGAQRAGLRNKRTIQGLRISVLHAIRTCSGFAMAGTTSKI
jgi:hypothetical protein